MTRSKAKGYRGEVDALQYFPFAERHRGQGSAPDVKWFDARVECKLDGAVPVFPYRALKIRQAKPGERITLAKLREKNAADYLVMRRSGYPPLLVVPLDPQTPSGWLDGLSLIYAKVLGARVNEAAAATAQEALGRVLEG